MLDSDEHWCVGEPSGPSPWSRAEMGTPPRRASGEPGEVVVAITRRVLSLDRSYLCVQGPPGTGKTYAATHAILALVGAGRRVGVLANSHKAILNLMGKAAGGKALRPSALV